VASQVVRCRPAAVTILEPHENHEWRSGLAVNVLYLWEIATVLSAKYADTGCRLGNPLKMENSSPFMEYPAPNLDRHTTTAFAGRHILQVVTLSLRSVN